MGVWCVRVTRRYGSRCVRVTREMGVWCVRVTRGYGSVVCEGD